MSGFFHRRKQSNSSANELDALVASLHAQTNENNGMKAKIQDLKEGIGKNKIIFEQFLKENEESEKNIQELKQSNSYFNEKIKEQEAKLKSLREIKFQLVTEKDTSNPQSNNIREIQDLLDYVDGKNEVLIFKDSHNITWEIFKKP
jgi:chromosome segregation ATPase